MLEKIENRLNKGGRKQRGRKVLKGRVNRTYPINSIAISANKDIVMRLEQFKQIRTDLSKIVSGEFQIIFTVLPNKPFTKKGILVRMGKGKGKIDHFSCNVKSGTICIILVSKIRKEEMRETNTQTHQIKSPYGDFVLLDNIKNKFLAKYPFLSFKSFF